MADALDLGSSSEKSKGSSPFARTKIQTLKKPCKLRTTGSLQGFCFVNSIVILCVKMCVLVPP